MLKHAGTQLIGTNRLVLRKFELEDAEDMFKNWANDSEVTKFLTWKPHKDVEGTREVIGQWVKEYERDNNYAWGIELKELGEVVGGISVVQLDEKNLSCEIGYCISRKYWGNGITSEALRGVVDYLFSIVGFNKIIAKHDTENVASGKVMLKSGMKYEGTLKQAKIRGESDFYDLAEYAILRDEWLSLGEI